MPENTPNLAPYQIAGQGIAAAGNLVSQLLTNKYNKEENERTRAYNLELWNKENAYNTPAAQMQRYKDAGLNTNLIYGSGASGGNAGSPSPASPVRYNAPQLDFPNVISAISAIQNYKNMQEIQYNLSADGLKKTEEARSVMLDNWIKYNGALDSIQPIGKGRYKYVSVNDNGFPNMGMMAAQKYSMGIDLLRENIHNAFNLNRIRRSEAELNEILKPHLMSSRDPIWARALLTGYRNSNPDFMKGVSDFLHPFRTIDNIKLDMDKLSGK